MIICKTALPRKQIVRHEGKLEIKEKSRSFEWRRGMRTKSPPRIRPSGMDMPHSTLLRSASWKPALETDI